MQPPGFEAGLIDTGGELIERGYMQFRAVLGNQDSIEKCSLDVSPYHPFKEVMQIDGLTVLERSGNIRLY